MRKKEVNNYFWLIIIRLNNHTSKTWTQFPLYLGLPSAYKPYDTNKSMSVIVTATDTIRFVLMLPMISKTKIRKIITKERLRHWTFLKYFHFTLGILSSCYTLFEQLLALFPRTILHEKNIQNVIDIKLSPVPWC